MGCTRDGMTEYTVPVEENGGVPVNVQDQTTPPLDALFAKSISNFTLAADTVASGITTLQYNFTANGGHGISINDEILLLDQAANKSFFSVVINVVVNVITVDRPIDHAFPSATALGRIVTTSMNVDGSVTPKIFSLRAGSIPTDAVRFLIGASNNSAMDYSLFAGLPALTRGLVFRIVNSFQKTIFCFKTDREMSLMCFDVKYADRAPAGEYGLISRFTFAGQDKHGVALRIQDDDVLQWIVQDDLTSLLTMQISAQGHETQD